MYTVFLQIYLTPIGPGLKNPAVLFFNEATGGLMLK